MSVTPDGDCIPHWRVGDKGDDLALVWGQVTRAAAQVVNEVCRGFDHPPGTARGTEATALAGKRNKVLMATTIAFSPNEVVFEAFAAQIVAKLRRQERRQRSLMVWLRLLGSTDRNSAGARRAATRSVHQRHHLDQPLHEAGPEVVDLLWRIKIANHFRRICFYLSRRTTGRSRRRVWHQLW